MAFKKAVIATSVDGIPEIVRDGDTGLLVPPEDVEALAAALLRLEHDTAWRAELGERARALVLRAHTWARFTERHVQLYRATVDV